MLLLFNQSNEGGSAAVSPGPCRRVREGKHASGGKVCHLESGLRM